MAFDDNLIKIDGFSGLYLRDTYGVLNTHKVSSINSKLYPKLKNETYLHFAMKLRINNRLERKNLTSIKLVGRTVKAAIDLANKEKEEIRAHFLCNVLSVYRLILLTKRRKRFERR